MQVYVVDAFTDTPFSGNPAGVVLLDAPAETAWMQSVAAELNHSETAFVVTDGADDEPKSLRWFTPSTEVDLCGHATLATAHVLGGEQRFRTASGELVCTPLEDGSVEMDLPLDLAEPVEPPEEIVDALPGVTIEACAQGTRWALVQVASAAEVRALHPDLDALKDAHDVIVTAAGDRPGLDFVSRVFAPHVGVPEDPVTGSAHCTLASYWSQKLGRTGHGERFAAEQASPRGGDVEVTVRGVRVGLTGRAVTVLRGQLHA